MEGKTGKTELTELQRELDQAYRLVAAVYVRGDGVDVMADVREHLRRAYRLAGQEETDG